ncbi:glycosyltransferase [Aurantibacter sp.]|uniref:glycosyltransferase n=1 Tax=Aurantibacter sp. TaxID=2807103 RepID=UPI0035C812A4
MTISIVFIGKNAAHLIEENYINRPFPELDFATEIIYVDSDSSDNSVALVKQLGWNCIELSSKGRLSAAAGRHIGTLQAKGDYILYLDSDMVLNLVNNKTIPDLIAKHTDKLNVSGFGGITIDVINSKKRKRIKREKDGQNASTYGGFVLLNRKDVLEAGNWNGNVIANEENELYARLIKNNKKVLISRDMECFHYTDRPSSRINILLNTYYPFTAKSKFVYGAPGLGLKSAIKNKSWKIYLKKFNREALFFALVFFVIILLELFRPFNFIYRFAAYVILFILFLYIVSLKRSIFFAVICPALFIQLVYGYFIYNEKAIVVKKAHE